MADFVCHNCGECCGPVPISEEERKRIEKFLKKHPGIRKQINQKGPSLKCVFRDEEKGCLIYSCRPKICKAYTCSSNEWMKTLKKPHGSLQFKLINDCFGIASSLENYKSMIDNYLQTLPKKS